MFRAVIVYQRLYYDSFKSNFKYRILHFSWLIS